MKSPCKAEVLSYLINTKEFRIIPTPIWRQVQSNAALSIESRFLWTVLWELCSLHPNFEKPLTWGFLSKRVGRSESTVRRWARALQSFGYLEIRSVYGQEGGQLPSLFRIGVPIEVAENVVKLFPDRRKKQLEDNSGAQDKPAAAAPDIQLDADYQESAPDIRHDAEPEAVAPDICEQAESDAAAPNISQQAESGAATPDYSQRAESADFAEKILKIGGEMSAPDIVSRLAKRVGSIGKGSDCSHTKRSEERQAHIPDQKDRSAYAKSESQPKPLSEAEKYDQELEEIRQRAVHLVKPSPVSGVGGEGVTSVLTRAGKSDTQDNNPAKQENNKQQGLRSLIRRALAVRLGIRRDLEQLVEEFAVSVEKGAFKKFDLVKAINIGVKLVREGRWVTPRFMP